jgi:hypothetical protein
MPTALAKIPITDWAIDALMSGTTSWVFGEDPLFDCMIIFAAFGPQRPTTAGCVLPATRVVGA